MTAQTTETIYLFLQYQGRHDEGVEKTYTLHVHIPKSLRDRLHKVYRETLPNLKEMVPFTLHVYRLNTHPYMRIRLTPNDTTNPFWFYLANKIEKRIQSKIRVFNRLGKDAHFSIQSFNIPYLSNVMANVQTDDYFVKNLHDIYESIHDYPLYPESIVDAKPHIAVTIDDMRIAPKDETHNILQMNYSIASYDIAILNQEAARKNIPKLTTNRIETTSIVPIKPMSENIVLIDASDETHPYWIELFGVFRNIPNMLYAMKEFSETEDGICFDIETIGIGLSIQVRCEPHFVPVLYQKIDALYQTVNATYTKDTYDVTIEERINQALDDNDLETLTQISHELRALHDMFYETSTKQKTNA